jgi:RimJ/RimL family protein N-acetyltransferase
MTGNVGSRRVLEKSGLIQVGTFASSEPDDAGSAGQGHVVYELIRAGWDARAR